ncbi:MAG TPA: OsmC family protein [Acidimicrobiia bacterium]|nr:OsmC family protein [Acidimicrobiia bacterium]
MTIAMETIRNGVDTATLFATLDAIKSQPELARFQFRCVNRWVDGSHNRSTIKGFYGAGGEDSSRRDSFELAAGEPQVLLGSDTGPNPAEILLHALAACLTTSLVYVAAARGVRLTEVTSQLEGNMDLRGALGLSDDYRNGYEDIKATFTVKGDGDEDQLRELMQRAWQRSAVFDIVSRGVPVEIEVKTS